MPAHSHHPYFDPKNDLMFKRIFGGNEGVLMSFLNALLPLPAEAPIVSLEYLTSEQVPEVPGLFKNSIVDVKCKDAQGRVFIVEMQKLWSSSFEQRIVFGASHAYVKQMRSGQSYGGLQPVYALALINAVYDHDTPAWYHHYEIVNLQNTNQKLEGLQFVFIEIPKFKPDEDPKLSIDKRMQIKWLKFMSQINEQTVTADPELEADPDIAKALGMVKVAALTAQEIELYHDQEDKARIEISVMEDARKEGAAEGEARGEARGKVEGKAEGELAAKRAIAGNLLAAGMDAKSVAAATGLAAAEVEKLRG